MVENAVGKKLKVLRSDNGGEYTGKQFQEYLKSEGVRHELTVPKTNGVAERLYCMLVEMVRTMLVEMVRTMLVGSKLGRSNVYSSISEKSVSYQSCRRYDTV